MRRHHLKYERNPQLIASRNECISHPLAQKLIDSVKITPEDICQYKNQWHITHTIANELDQIFGSIFCDNGSEQVLRNVIGVLSTCSTEWVSTDPIFEMVPFFLFKHGCTLEQVPFTFRAPGYFTHNFDEIENKEDKILYITSPHCPTGVNWDIREMCDQFKYVVLDEAYENPLAPVWRGKNLPNLITIRSFSKMGIAAGLRFGFAHSHDHDLIEKINEFRPQFICSITQKYVREMVNLGIPNQYYRRLENVVRPKYEKLIGNKLVLFSGNYALLTRTEDFMGYPLKRYFIDGKRFQRLTLFDNGEV